MRRCDGDRDDGGVRSGRGPRVAIGQSYRDISGQIDDARGAHGGCLSFYYWRLANIPKQSSGSPNRVSASGCDREQSQSRAINVGAWSLLWNKSPLHTVYKRRRTATARHGPSAFRYCRNHGQSVRQLWRGMMKTLFAALALVTLLASPTFAQTANSPTCGGYGWGPSSPCFGANP